MSTQPVRQAVLLVGHGAEAHADAARILRRHAEALRSAGGFAQVETGFLAGSPAAATMLSQIGAPIVHIVPFFMEDGYFTRTAVPAALSLDGPLTRRGGQILHYRAPVGTHPGIVDLIAARLRHHAPDIHAWRILLVGHGSARAPGRALVLHRHAATLRREFPDLQLAFLEEAPFLPDALAMAPERPVAVLGIFAGGGRHAEIDLPAAIAQCRRDRGPDGAPVASLGIIGDDPGLTALLLERISQTDPGT